MKRRLVNCHKIFGLRDASAPVEKEFHERVHEVLEDKRSRKQNQDAHHSSEELFEQIGRFKVDNDFLKELLFKSQVH